MLIGTLAYGLGLDMADFDADLADADDRLDLLGQSAANAAASDVATPGGGGAGGEGGAGAADAVGRIGPALAAALAPLNQIGSLIARQLDVIGGTVVTLARRIDDSMKMPGALAALGAIEKRFEGTWLAAAAGAGRMVLQIRGWLSNLGDVAGKGLSGLNTMTLAAPVAGAAKLAANVTGVAPAAKAATSAVSSLGRELMAALGIFGAAYAVVNFFKSGITGAMNLGETMSKTKEVFGDATSSVVGQADEMAKAFGLPKGAMLDAASSIGLIAQGAGLAKEKSADMANTMARLAADASSFYNVPLDAALEKIRSGLVGEAEPMRGFGVLLSETAVKQEALRLGLASSAGAIDERSKVVARASLIEKGLQTASGDLARTADSAANQFRAAGGGVANFATRVGELLLPAVQSGIGAFNELMASVIETFEGNLPLITAWADGIKAAMDFVGLAVRNFGTLWKITELTAAEAVGNVLAVVDTIAPNLAVIGEWIANNWVKLITDGLNFVGTGFANLGKNLADFGKAVIEFFKNPTGGFNFNLTSLTEGFKATADALPELVKPAWVSMQDEIDKLGADMADREAKRAEGIAKGAPAKAAASLDKAEKGDSTPKLAKAAELGSKDAYETIARFQSAGARGDSGKDTAANTSKLVDKADKQIGLLSDVKDVLAGWGSQQFAGFDVTSL